MATLIRILIHYIQYFRPRHTLNSYSMSIQSVPKRFFCFDEIFGNSIALQLPNAANQSTANELVFISPSLWRQER